MWQIKGKIPPVQVNRHTFVCIMTTERSHLLDEISGLLMDSEVFKKTPPQEVRALAHYFGLSEIEEGETIFDEGDKGTFMCIVGSGEVTVLKSNLEGDTVTLARLRKGKTFGEMALLDGERRSATCIASDDCVLLTLSQDSLNKMLEEAPKTAACVFRAMAVALSRRLRMADGKLVDLEA